MNIQKRTFSQLRRALIHCAQEINILVKSTHMLSDTPLIKGSVYELKRKCGKPGCKCAKGHLHARMVVSSSQEGRTRLRVIPAGFLVEVRQKVRDYQEFRRSRARLGELHRKMLQIINQMEVCRREEMPKPVRGAGKHDSGKDQRGTHPPHKK